MAASYKAPPELTDEKSFGDWTKELKIWQLATEVKTEKQAAMLFLSLKGKAREAALELSEEEIGAADGSGVSKITDKLKKLFKEDENLEAFNAYEKFEKFHRSPDMNMRDFINTFDRLNNKLIATNTVLPEGVLAYRLLKSANLTKEQEQLSKATVTAFTYEAMTTKLKNIFGDTRRNKPSEGQGISKLPSDVAVKQEAYYENLYEEAYYEQRYPGQKNPGVRHDTYAGRNVDSYSNNSGWSRGRGVGQKRGYANRNLRGKGWKANNSNSDGQNRTLNPINDITGEPSRCTICDSVFHWMRDCRKTRQPNRPLFSLFSESSIQECYVSKIVEETLSCGLLDCGCTKTVCGTDWYRDFVKSMSAEDKKAIELHDSKVPYKFGCGDVVYSNKIAQIPIYVGSQRGMLATEIVDIDLPLLVSKEAMKTAGMVLDFKKDLLIFKGEEVALETSSSGHYILPLTEARSKMTKLNYGCNEEALLAINVEYKSEKEKWKMIAKLHLQFGHPTYDKLATLVKLAGVKDDAFFGMMKDYSENCQTCMKYRKKNPRPVVGMSLSTEFNGTIAMDLKMYKAHIILHIIDLATRYSNATVIKNKKKETVVDTIITEWVNKFGVPDRILSDNGGEFNNDDMRDMSENLNTELTTTAAESPWSNGTCERHNAVISNMLDKIIDETGCTIKVALAWAINAKNCLHNVYGFSPAQLVFGRNPNLPSILNDKLPALGGTTKSEEVAKHLNAKHEARKAFVENEASEKIRRALRHNIRKSTTKEYNLGDKVYYKRLEDKKWKGPAFVIGKDEHQVLVKHQGQPLRTHPVSLRKVNDISPKQVYEPKVSSNEDKGTLNRTQALYNDYGDSDDNSVEDVQQNCNNINNPDEAIEDDGMYDQLEDENVVNEHNDITNDIPVIAEDDEAENTIAHMSAYPEQDEQVVITNEINRPVNLNQSELTQVNKQTLPKPKTHIQFREEDSENPWQKAAVINRAGKATAGNKMWMNVQTIPDGKQMSVDFNKTEWKATEESALLSRNWDHDVMEAKAIEFQNLKDNNAFKEVCDEGQQCIGSRWVITEKVDEDGKSMVKARLVAKGYQENTETIRKDSPTCAKEFLRIMLAIAATNKWQIRSLDIKSAFLQGRELEREVYIKPPPEFAQGMLWKLRKALYGLNDAAREWHLKVQEAMEEMEAIKSTLDNAIFYWRREGELIGICACHVDDFIKCGSDQFLMNVNAEIKRRFKVSSECEGIFKYIGLQVMQKGDHIRVSQNQYQDDINLFDQARSSDTPLNEIQKRELKSLAGSLNWISSHSRPDIAYDVCEVNTSIKDATHTDLFNANKAIRKLKSQEVDLLYPNLSSIENSKLVVYSDASFKNLKGGASQGGYLVFMRGPNGNYCLIAWQSKKIKRIVKSTLAAEALALQEGANHAFVIKSFLNEITGLHKFPIITRTDNRSLEQCVKTTNSISDKRLEMDIGILRELLERKEIAEVQWVPNEMQLADCLTKKGASSKKLLQALKGCWKM